MKSIRRALLAGVLAVTSAAAWCQTPPAPGAPAPFKPLALRYEREPLTSVARDLSRRTGRPVLLDSTVRAQAPVTLATEAKDLEDALAQVTTAVGFQWRKVYLPAATAAPAREGDKAEEWTGDQVRAAALAVEALTGNGVIVEERGRATLFVRSVPAASDFEGKVRATWPQMRPYYLITNPTVPAPGGAAKREAVAERRPGEEAVAAFADLERQRMAAFLQLSPEQRTTAMSQGMDFMLQADPAVMQEMMQAGMQAWMQSMQRMNPEQRQQLIQRQIQMMQSIPPQVWQDLFSLFRPQQP
jgi:hypothetical protein